MPTRDYYLAAVAFRWGASALAAGATEATLKTSVADWLPNTQLADSVDIAIEECLAAIADTSMNSDRDPLLTTKIQITHGAKLTTALIPRSGKLTGVRVTHEGSGATDNLYRPAEPDEVTSVLEYVEDKADGTSDVKMPAYRYAYYGGRLYHTGTFASVEYFATPTDFTAAAQLVPRRYAAYVIARGCELVALAVAPSRAGAAQHFRTMAEATLAAIYKNEAGPTPDEVVPYEGT